ncbi:MAG TPA: hypothetical protein VFX15_13150 [Actinomycetes bacterium]|nr:hypothetical protein [Actinomycetes bacterium]
MMRVGVILALLGASVTLPMAAAHACTCADATPAKHLRAADAVFLGAVVGQDPPAGSSEASSASDIKLTVDVERVFKGDVSAEQEVTAQGIAGYCGLTFGVSDAVLVFATSESVGGGAPPKFVTSLCSGTERAATVPKSFGDGKRPVGYVSASADVEEGGFPVGAVAVGLVVVAAGAGAVGWGLRRRGENQAGAGAEAGVGEEAGAGNQAGGANV